MFYFTCMSPYKQIVGQIMTIETFQRTYIRMPWKCRGRVKQIKEFGGWFRIKNSHFRSTPLEAGSRKPMTVMVDKKISLISKYKLVLSRKFKKNKKTVTKHFLIVAIQYIFKTTKMQLCFKLNTKLIKCR